MCFIVDNSFCCYYQKYRFKVIVVQIKFSFSSIDYHIKDWKNGLVFLYINRKMPAYFKNKWSKDGATGK